METKEISSRPEDFDTNINRIIQFAVRNNGKFFCMGKELKYTSSKVSISEVRYISNNNEYNRLFCGSVVFNLLQKGEEGFENSSHYKFEGFALVEENKVISLSKITCNKVF